MNGCSTGIHCHPIRRTARCVGQRASGFRHPRAGGDLGTALDHIDTSNLQARGKLSTRHHCKVPIRRTAACAGMTVSCTGTMPGSAGITEKSAVARRVGMTEQGTGIRRSRGFTLFEMLIAVSIFAIIGVVAFGGLGQMTRTGQAVAEANDRLANLQFAVVYFTRDWTQVSRRKIRDQYGDEASNIILDDGIITFTRSGWSNLLGHKRSTLQRVQYLVIDNQLVRRHWRSLDHGIGELPLEAVLLDEVESLEVEFLDALEKPIRTWPVETSLEAGNPIALAFRLDLSDIGEVTRILELPSGAL